MAMYPALLLPPSLGRVAYRRYFADVLYFRLLSLSFSAPRRNGTMLRQLRENGGMAIGSQAAISISGNQTDFKRPRRYISYVPPPLHPQAGPYGAGKVGELAYRGPLNLGVPKVNSVWRVAVLRRGPLVRRQDQMGQGSRGGDSIPCVAESLGSGSAWHFQEKVLARE